MKEMFALEEATERALRLSTHSSKELVFCYKRAVIQKRRFGFIMRVSSSAAETNEIHFKPPDKQHEIHSSFTFICFRLVGLFQNFIEIKNPWNWGSSIVRFIKFYVWLRYMLGWLNYLWI